MWPFICHAALVQNLAFLQAVLRQAEINADPSLREGSALLEVTWWIY